MLSLELEILNLIFLEVQTQFQTLKLQGSKSCLSILRDCFNKFETNFFY